MTAPAVAAPPAAVPPAESAAPPAAPAASPPATPPADAPATEGTKLIGRDEARRRAQEKGKTLGTEAAAEAAAATEPAPKPDAAGTEPAKPAGDAPAPAGEQPPAAGTEPAPAATIETHKVPIYPQHPIYGSSGVKEFTVGTAEEARALKGLLNGTSVRRQENELLKTALAKAEDRIIQLESMGEAEQEFTAMPEYQQAVQHYHDLKEAHGEAVANDYWEGFRAKFRQKLNEKVSARTEKVEADRHERSYRAWKEEAWVNTRQMINEAVAGLPEFSKYFEEAVASFGSELDLGHFPEVQSSEQMHQEFLRFFNTVLARKQSVRAIYEQMKQGKQGELDAAAKKAAADQAERERIGREAIEKHLREQAEKRAAAPPHPLGRVAAASQSSAPAAGAGGDDSLPANASPGQVRRASREAARQRTRQALGG